MVIIHIANIDTAIIGGVQVAVPKMVSAQSQYAEVGLVNTHGDIIDNVQMLEYDGIFDINKFPAPFNKPDVVIFHEVYRFEYIKFYRTLLKRNVPYVIIPHGCLSKKAQQKKRLKKVVANAIFFNAFLKAAQSIQYLSENEKNMSAFSKYDSFVLDNGIFVPTERKTSFSNKGLKFVYIGRLEVYIKGLDLLLGAVKKCEMLMKQHGAKVEIYGPDYNDSHECITRMIRDLKIADLVSIGKEKTGEEKKRILLSSDCFLQTSRTEGLPLGLLEALGYGLPCIVTEGVGLGTMVELYGAGYQRANSIDAIADAIECFIRDFEKANSMSKGAINLVKEKFDIDLVAKKTVEQYQFMLDKSTSGKDKRHVSF